MRFKKHMEFEGGANLIDITPLIDMVFQLLIFFMLTSSFIVQSGIRVNLPKTVTAEVLKEENLVIIVSRENVLYVGERVVTNKELEKILFSAFKDARAVLIRADQRANLGRVVEVWDMAKAIGITQINIATDKNG